MKDLILKNTEYLTKLTKEQADFIEDVLKWDQDQRAAFILAKQLFEEDLKENQDEKISVVCGPGINSSGLHVQCQHCKCSRD